MPTYKLIDTASLNLSADAEALYQSMLNQGDGHTRPAEQGGLWLDVYLDNARVGFPATGKRLSGLFSALQQKGLYRPMDDEGFWGEIRVEVA